MNKQQWIFNIKVLILNIINYICGVNKNKEKMKYLKISSNGLLDIRLLSLMGGTTKANDQFKIGQWGSGLKYSMAWLLRNNLDFHVYIGQDHVYISTVREVIRGEEFEVIHVNGEKTSVTTNMGGDAWVEWMIVRELWCNALDEGGEEIEVTESLEGSTGKTSFFIQLTSQFNEVMDNFDEYFIHRQKPIHVDGSRSIYYNKGAMKLYKQGVRIHKSAYDSVFGYNINNARLNELREYNGSQSLEVRNCLADAPVEVIKYFIENLKSTHYEASMDWNWSGKLSDNWLEAIGDKKVTHEEQLLLLMAFNKSVDTSNIIILPKNLCGEIVKYFPSLALTKVRGKDEFIDAENELLEVRVSRMRRLLESKGYHIPPRIIFEYGHFTDKNVIARADIKNNVVSLSEQLNDKTDYYLCSTIIEEVEHIKTGMQDETRSFKQHFIDLYTKEVLDRETKTEFHLN